MFSKNRLIKIPFWLMVSGIMILLTVPKLIQDGMFLDAMLYTCVSHNLSNGIGTFWFPQYSPSLFSGYPFFLEHPPLVFGIQSVFFRLLGDSMYVERFYVFLTMCITAFLISLLWKDIYKKEEGLKEISWLPIIFWISIPTWFWSYSNNMMENTMTIFDLCAVILIYRASESDKREYIRIIIAGISVFMATLSKGVPGLFPVVMPFLYWLIIRKKSLVTAILQTIILLFVISLICFILFNLPQSKESLTFYLKERLLDRINDVPTTSDRLYTIKRLIAELLLPLALAIFAFITAKITRSNIRKPGFSNPVLFLMIGLSASVPLTLTFVQRGFYLVPSFPYFAIGISALIAPIVLYFKEMLIHNKKHLKIFTITAIAIFILSIGYSFMQKGKTQRDRGMLHDVHAIGNTIPQGSGITVNQEIASTHVLECYFIRYYYISLYVDKPKQYLMIKKSVAQDIPIGYRKLDIETNIYDVYRME